MMANVEKVTELSNVGQDLKHDFLTITKNLKRITSSNMITYRTNTDMNINT